MALATPLLQKDIQNSPTDSSNLLNSPVSKGFGTHLLVEMWHAPFSSLADAESVSSILQYTVSHLQMDSMEETRVNTFQFDPYGVSATATSSVLHILMHTWPEKGYAAVDIFARNQADAFNALERIKFKLNPKDLHVMELARGQLLNMEDT